jgi:hypothetical protein
LVLVGMPGTAKFKDLQRDPRFMLHTATVDTYVREGDAKVWGRVVNLRDKDLHARFAQQLFDESGFDLRGRDFDPFFVADLEGGSSLELENEQLKLTVWRPGQGERLTPVG